jgi:hypothetical protein
VFLDDLGDNLAVGGDGANGGFLIVAHEAAVTFNIGTEDCREIELGKGRSGSEM